METTTKLCGNLESLIITAATKNSHLSPEQISVKFKIETSERAKCIVTLSDDTFNEAEVTLYKDSESLAIQNVLANSKDTMAYIAEFGKAALSISYDSNIRESFKEICILVEEKGAKEEAQKIVEFEKTHTFIESKEEAMKVLEKAIKFIKKDKADKNIRLQHSLSFPCVKIFKGGDTTKKNICISLNKRISYSAGYGLNCKEDIIYALESSWVEKDILNKINN